MRFVAIGHESEHEETVGVDVNLRQGGSVRGRERGREEEREGESVRGRERV